MPSSRPCLSFLRGAMTVGLGSDETTTSQRPTAHRTPQPRSRCRRPRGRRPWRSSRRWSVGTSVPIAKRGTPTPSLATRLCWSRGPRLAHDKPVPGGQLAGLVLIVEGVLRKRIAAGVLTRVVRVRRGGQCVSPAEEGALRRRGGAERRGRGRDRHGAAQPSLSSSQHSQLLRLITCGRSSVSTGPTG